MFAPKYPANYLCYYGITSTRPTKHENMGYGSSKYLFSEGELIDKKELSNSPKNTTPPAKKSIKDRMLDFREYSINKSKVRQKIFAFYHLKDSYKYFRLWTLTFPKGTHDNTAYKILNNWLTRMRTELGLKNYIWIAERQQNSTIHFHLIFAQYINIQKANYYASKAINNSIKKGEIWRQDNKELNYNGLDVSKKCGSWTQVAKYVTKYITKSTTTCTRLPYYCSQTISRLFTKLVVTEEYINNQIQDNKISIDTCPKYTSDFYEFYTVKIKDINSIFAQLFTINNYIYSLQKT